MLKNGLCEYDIAKEYVYHRDAKLAATYLDEHYPNEKLLIYGDGSHSAEVIEAVLCKNILIGVVRQADKDENFVEAKINLSHYDIEQVGMLEYAYIVLLGYWRDGAVDAFAKKHKISKRKLLIVYKTEWMQKRLIADSEQKALGAIADMRLSGDKKRLALILRRDVRDFATMSSEQLSNAFAMTKIYIGDTALDDNTYFDNVLFCDNDLDYFETLLGKLDFDIALFFCTCSHDYALGLYVKRLLPTGTKFVLMSVEYAFDSYLNLTPEEMLDIYGRGDKGLLELQKSSAEELARVSDGFVSNVTGSFFENELKRRYKNPFYSQSFMPHERFIDSSDVNINDSKVNIVYTGSIFAKPNHIPDVRALCLLPMCKKLLAAGSGYGFHVYSWQGNKTELSEELGRDERFIFHNFMPHLSMPLEIAKYHFGFIWFKIDEVVARTHANVFHSTFNSKVVTYLAAGLPFIVHKDLTLIAKFVKDNGIGLVLDESDLDNFGEIIADIDYTQMRRRVMECQLRFIAENHPKKLTEYFIEILN